MHVNTIEFFLHLTTTAAVIRNENKCHSTSLQVALEGLCSGRVRVTRSFITEIFGGWS